MGLLFLFSFSLFLINNGHEQVWYDESLTLHFSGLEFGTMLHEIGFNGAEANPPLFHIMMKALRTVFGDSLPVLRGFSALCAGLLVVAQYFFIKKIFNEKTALFASVLLVLNPIVIAFSQELRMYMFAALLVFISLCSLYLAVEEKKKRYWIFFVLAAVAGIYTHYYSFFALFVSFLYIVFHLIDNRRDFRREKKTLAFYAVSVVIILASFVPWLAGFYKQLYDMSFAQWTESMKPDILLRIIGYFFTTKFSYDVNPILPYVFFGVFALIFIAFGIYYQIRKKTGMKALIFFLAAFFIPVIISFTYSLFFYSIINFRYFVIFFPFFVVLFAYGLGIIPYKKLSLIFLFGFIILLSPTVLKIYTDNFNGSARDTSEYIRENVKTDDAVITFENTSFLTLFYYLKQPENLYYYSDERLPDCYGVNIRPQTYVVGRDVQKVIREHASLWLVLTPWSKDMADSFVNANVNLFVDPTVNPKLNNFESSWIKHKIIHLVKLRQSND
jgi:predicted membrane-bound mannosyltransferase